MKPKRIRTRVSGINIYVGRRLDCTVHRTGSRSHTYLGITMSTFDRVRRAAVQLSHRGSA